MAHKRVALAAAAVIGVLLVIWLFRRIANASTVASIGGAPVATNLSEQQQRLQTGRTLGFLDWLPPFTDATRTAPLSQASMSEIIAHPEARSGRGHF